MTPEEKQLLLRDLCARLPYGVKCRFETTVDTYKTIELSREGTNGIIVDFDEIHCYWFNEGFIIPYLRPMSSMTDEEIDRMWEIYESGPAAESSVAVAEYLYERHLDCHYLIEKGLAIEAPEGMYKTE